MKSLKALLLAFLVLFAVVTPAVMAQETHECGYTGLTISALHHCVEHAVMMSHINSVVAQSLYAKLNAAQNAYVSGRTATAINLLRALVNEVSALSGTQIEAGHAAHIIEHAQAVIAALS